MAREVEEFGCMECIKQVDDVDVEVLLKPYYVTLSTVKNLQIVSYFIRWIS